MITYNDEYSINPVYATALYLPEDKQKENPLPGEIFFSEESFKEANGEVLMLNGYAICLINTTTLATFSEEFYDTFEEAQEALQAGVSTVYNVVVTEEFKPDSETNQVVEFHYLLKKELRIARDNAGDFIDSKVKVKVGFIEPLTEEEIALAHENLIPLDFIHLIPEDRLKYIIPVTKEAYDKSDY